MSGNYGHGGVTQQEWGQATTDAIKDAITSFTSAAGAYYGAAGTQAFKESMTESLLNAGWKPWMIRAAAGADGMVVSQAWMSAGNIASTGIDVGYEESQGLITPEQGGDMLLQAFGNALFNVLTAPIAGAAGGILPEGAPGQIKVSQVLAQAGVNLGINTFLTEGNEFLRGGWNAVTSNFGQDAISIGVNTVASTAVHVGGEFIRGKFARVPGPSGNVAYADIPLDSPFEEALSTSGVAGEVPADLFLVNPDTKTITLSLDNQQISARFLGEGDAGAVLKLAFTYGMQRIARIEYNRVDAGELPHPRNNAVPLALLGGALVLAEILAALQKAGQQNNWWGWFDSNGKKPDQNSAPPKH